MESIEFEQQHELVKELFNNDKNTFDTFKDLYFLSHNLWIYAHFLYTHMLYESEIKTYSQFFIYESCMRHLTIGLGMIFTEKDGAKKDTGCKLLESIFKNENCLNKEVFTYQLLGDFNCSLKGFNEQKDEVEKIYTDKIKVYRDKRYAHLDSNLFSHIKKNEKVDINDIKTIEKFCHQIKEMCTYIFNNKQGNIVVGCEMNDSCQLLELYNQAGDITYG
ncbi:hypothetical protein [Francisella sp. SYW-9]|uniref:hypothetical protein n=1 Tax=Francisella sp. SYW-9 TaxID=2610888 RepID=UPI00123D3254|nr:hypothetical protein [Francisella sp. SYW-9]